MSVRSEARRQRETPVFLPLSAYVCILLLLTLAGRELARDFSARAGLRPAAATPAWGAPGPGGFVEVAEGLRLRGPLSR